MKFKNAKQFFNTRFVITCIFLILFTFLSSTLTFGSIDSMDKKVAKKYEKFLTQKKTLQLITADNQKASLNLRQCYFNVKDIDGDGTDELILCSREKLSSNSFVHGRDIYFFSCISGKVKYLGSIQNPKDELGFYYSPYYHAVLSTDFGDRRSINYFNQKTDSIYRVYTLYGIRKNHLYIKKSCGSVTVQGKGIFCEKVKKGMKEITWQDYINKTNRYFMTSMSIDLVRNTKINRKAYLYHKRQ